ncbi:MAG: hypothetical protein ACFFDN_35835 [Candidatus Hodarchaeota archaeon]
MINENKETKLPSNEKVDKFDMLEPLLESIYYEMSEFSRKKQDLQLNKLKAKMINKILEEIRIILSEEPIIEFLDLLEEDTLPTNSDAVLIIGQYRNAMHQFKKKFYRYDKSRWSTKENPIKHKS